MANPPVWCDSPSPFAERGLGGEVTPDQFDGGTLDENVCDIRVHGGDNVSAFDERFHGRQTIRQPARITKDLDLHSVRQTTTSDPRENRDEDRTRRNSNRTLCLRMLRRRDYARKRCNVPSLPEVQRTFHMGTRRSSTGESRVIGEKMDGSNE